MTVASRLHSADDVAINWLERTAIKKNSRKDIKIKPNSLHMLLNALTKIWLECSFNLWQYNQTATITVTKSSS